MVRLQKRNCLVFRLVRKLLFAAQDLDLTESQDINMHSNPAGQPNTSQNDLILSYMFLQSWWVHWAWQQLVKGNDRRLRVSFVSTSVIVGTAIQLSSDIIRSDDIYIYYIIIYIYIYIYIYQHLFSRNSWNSHGFLFNFLIPKKTIDLQPWSSMLHGRHQESFVNFSIHF